MDTPQSSGKDFGPPGTNRRPSWMGGQAREDHEDQVDEDLEVDRAEEVSERG